MGKKVSEWRTELYALRRTTDQQEDASLLPLRSRRVAWSSLANNLAIDPSFATNVSMLLVALSNSASKVTSAEARQAAVGAAMGDADHLGRRDQGHARLQHGCCGTSGLRRRLDLSAAKSVAAQLESSARALTRYNYDRTRDRRRRVTARGLRTVAAAMARRCVLSWWAARAARRAMFETTATTTTVATRRSAGARTDSCSMPLAQALPRPSATQQR